MENSPGNQEGFNNDQEAATVPVPEFNAHEANESGDDVESVPVKIVEAESGETTVIGENGETATATKVVAEYEDGSRGTIISAEEHNKENLLDILTTPEMEAERLKELQRGKATIDAVGMGILSKNEKQAKEYWEAAQKEGQEFQKQYDEDEKNGLHSESGKINQKVLNWTLGLMGVAGLVGVGIYANMNTQPGMVQEERAEEDGGGIEQGERLMVDQTGYVALEESKSAKPYAENVEGKAYEKDRVPGGMAERDALKGLGQKETLDVLFGGGEIADEDGLGTMPAMLGTFLNHGLLSEDLMNELGVNPNDVSSLSKAENYVEGLSKEKRLAIAEAIETHFFEKAEFSDVTVDGGGNYTNSGVLLKEQDGKIVDSRMIQSTINSTREAKKFELNGKSVYFLERCANIVFFEPPADIPKFDEDTGKKWEDLHEDIPENNQKEELQEDEPTETPPPTGDTTPKVTPKDWTKQNKEIVENNKPEGLQEQKATEIPPPVGDTSKKNTSTNTTNNTTTNTTNTNTNTGGNTNTTPPPVENGMGGSTKAPEQGVKDQKANEEKAKAAEELNKIVDSNGQVPKEEQINRFQNLE